MICGKKEEGRREEGREGRREEGREGRRGERRKEREEGGEEEGKEAGTKKEKGREERGGGGREKKKHSLGVGACSNIATEVGVPHSHPHILTPSHLHIADRAPLASQVCLHAWSVFTGGVTRRNGCLLSLLQLLVVPAGGLILLWRLKRGERREKTEGVRDGGGKDEMEGKGRRKTRGAVLSTVSFSPAPLLRTGWLHSLPPASSPSPLPSP